MSTCVQCTDRPTTGESALCLKCAKSMISEVEEMLKKKARRYFEASLLGMTTSGILFLTDDEEFTAYLVLTRKEIDGLRDYLNATYPAGENEDE